MHAFRTYIVCQSLHTLQRALAAIADLFVYQTYHRTEKYMNVTTLF